MRIELNPYDKNDMLRVIEYARRKTEEDYRKEKLPIEEYKSNLSKIELSEKILSGGKTYKRYPGMKGDAMDFEWRWALREN